MSKTLAPRPEDVLPDARAEPAMFAEQRARLCETLKANGVSEGSLVVLKAGDQPTLHSADVEPVFRQEQFFWYLLGVRDPGCYATIDVHSGRTTLYIPRLPETFAVWMGTVHPPEHYRVKYEVDACDFVDNMEESMKSSGADTLLVLQGTNSDSGLSTTPAAQPFFSDYTVDKETLHDVVAEQRVIKTEREIEWMRRVNDVSSAAHIAIMRSCEPGMKEYQLESLFQHWCYYTGGARHMAYTCICASGCNGSVLHYGHVQEPNEKTVLEGDMCLFDMGGECDRYASDITCSFPATGKFTPQQRVVYDAVLATQWGVMDAMKPGVSWMDMHELAYRITLKHLVDAGVLTGDVEEMLVADFGAVFMPHGLGHFIGIDTHDVGGYLPGTPERSSRPGFRSLRTSRVLEAGMVITVEPGCYFNDYCLDKALADESQSKFIVKEKLAEFRGCGGVRLEDDVVITATGIENLTSCPRLPEEVEAVMAGSLTRQELTLKAYRGF